MQSTGSPIGNAKRNNYIKKRKKKRGEFSVTLTMEINIDCQSRRGFVQTIRPSSDNTTACWHHEDDSSVRTGHTVFFIFNNGGIALSHPFLIYFFMYSHQPF
jgi:hypothetical protein